MNMPWQNDKLLLYINNRLETVGFQHGLINAKTFMIFQKGSAF